MFVDDCIPDLKRVVRPFAAWVLSVILSSCYLFFILVEVGMVMVDVSAG